MLTTRRRTAARLVLVALFLAATLVGLRALFDVHGSTTVGHGVRRAADLTMVAAGALGLVELARVHRRGSSELETRLITLALLGVVGGFFLQLDYAPDHAPAVHVVATTVVLICGLWLVSWCATAIRPRRETDRAEDEHSPAAREKR